MNSSPSHVLGQRIARMIAIVVLIALVHSTLTYWLMFWDISNSSDRFEEMRGATTVELVLHGIAVGFRYPIAVPIWELSSESLFRAPAAILALLANSLVTAATVYVVMRWVIRQSVIAEGNRNSLSALFLRRKG